MKKKPHKLPCELHDPKPDTPVCAQPLDLSDQPPQTAETMLPGRESQQTDGYSEF